MITLPNLYTLPEEPSGIFGLHKFPEDGKLSICQHHKSGEWHTVRPPTLEELAHFKEFGIPTAVEPPVRKGSAKEKPCAGGGTHEWQMVGVDSTEFCIKCTVQREVTCP